MEKRDLGPVICLLAVIGATLLNASTAGATIGAVGSVCLLLTLFCFDSGAARSGAESLAFSAAAAFCALGPLQLFANWLSPAASGERWWFQVAAWAILTGILIAVDRFRVSAGQPLSLGASSFTPTSVRPAPSTPTRAPNSVPTEIFVPQPTSPKAEPIPQVTTAAPVEPPPVQPPAEVTLIPPGREAVIYLNLVGEGLNVLRTVRAENLGRDYYRIADIMPEGEQWEFTPGQVVRCRKKSLSNGKHMVAYEEAPRAI